MGTEGGGGGLALSLLEQPWFRDGGEPRGCPGGLSLISFVCICCCLVQNSTSVKWKQIPVLFAVLLYSVSPYPSLWSLVVLLL